MYLGLKKQKPKFLKRIGSFIPDSLISSFCLLYRQYHAVSSNHLKETHFDIHHHPASILKLNHETKMFLVYTFGTNLMSHDLRRLPLDLADDLNTLSCLFVGKTITHQKIFFAVLHSLCKTAKKKF